MPENLPGPLYARKVQRRAASTGFDWPDLQGPLDAVREELAEVEEAARASSGPDEAAEVAGAARASSTPGEASRDVAFHEVGDLLFAAVSVARKLRVDPELALRAAADRFRARVERGAALAAEGGYTWSDLAAERQMEYYSRATINYSAPTAEGPPGEP